MDDLGRIEQKLIIEGIKKINDMESIISYGPHRLYVLASQSYNREGIQPTSCKLFIRIRQNGRSLVLDKSISLFDLLVSSAHESNNSVDSASDYLEITNISKQQVALYDQQFPGNSVYVRLGLAPLESSAMHGAPKKAENTNPLPPYNTSTLRFSLLVKYLLPGYASFQRHQDLLHHRKHG